MFQAEIEADRGGQSRKQGGEDPVRQRVFAPNCLEVVQRAERNPVMKEQEGSDEGLQAQKNRFKPEFINTPPC